MLPRDPRATLPLSLLLGFALPIFGLRAQDANATLDTAGFDTFAERLIEEFKVPGMAVAIVHRDRLIHAKGYGFRDVEKKLPVDADTLFPIASATKAFTALGVALLVHEGKVAFDDPVRKHLPEFRMYDAVASEQLTVEDILCHRSGLPRYEAAWYGAERTRAELVAALRWLPPTQPLRTKWQYQNLMFVTAGYLIERVSGSTWEQFTRQRIFVPLGMQRSNLSVTVSKSDANAAQPYIERERVPFRNIDAVGPAGSINSSVRDMALWVRVLLNKGKLGDSRVFPAPVVKTVMQPRMVTGRERTSGEFGHETYALGWKVQTYRGHLLVHHAGSVDGFNSMVTLFPDADLGVVMLSNEGHNPSAQVPALWVADHILGMAPVDWVARTKKRSAEWRQAREKARAARDGKRVEGTRPSHSLADYTGEYEHKGYGVATIALDAKKDGLTFELNGIAGPLGHFHYDVFRLQSGNREGLQVQFRTGLDGEVQALCVQLEPGLAPFVFTRTPRDRLSDPMFLGKLVGEYERGSRVVKITMNDGKLFVSVPGQPTYELQPDSGTRFRVKGKKGFLVEFKLDDDGRPVEVDFQQLDGLLTARRRAG